MKVINKRKITRGGERLDRPQPPQHLKRIPHRRLMDALAPAVRGVRVHVERRFEAATTSDWHRWAYLKGLLENAIEMHRAATVLLAEKQNWPQMPGAASLLTRGLVETLGHVMLIGENPGIVHAFERHHYRETFEQLREMRDLWALNPAFRETIERHEALLTWLAEKMRLAARDAERPPKTWRAPKVAAYAGGQTPLLSGSRRVAFRAVYLSLYRPLSWHVHVGFAAVALPLTEEKHGPLPLLRSNITSKAATLLAAILSELTEITECKPPVTLFTLWSLLQDVIELPREIYRVRYRSLLEQSALRDLRHP